MPRTRTAVLASALATASVLVACSSGAPAQPPAKVAVTTPKPRVLLVGDSITGQYGAFYKAMYPDQDVRLAGGSGQDPLTSPWAVQLIANGQESAIVLQDFKFPAEVNDQWKVAWIYLVRYAKQYARRVVILAFNDMNRPWFYSLGAAEGVPVMDMVPSDYGDGIHYGYDGAIAMARRVHASIG